jgi:uncharacterized protein YbaP (TraB family)
MRRIARLYALALLICCLQPIAPAHAAAPVWSVKGKHNTVYLLGSVHFLSASEKLPAAADAAYAEAESLLMEIDLDDLDPREMQQLTLELGLLPDNQTLETHLGPEVYPKVAAHARELGVDPALLNRFRPWFAALTLVQLHLMKMGLDPSAGVEQRLAARAAADAKPIEGLETIREQLTLLASLPDEQQREFLLYSVEDAERATREIDALIDAWRRGDAQALAKLLSHGFDQFPDLYRPLTVERNRKWLSDLTDLLDDRDDYLVVVGTLHLVGDDSVVELLRGKGYKVTQH